MLRRVWIAVASADHVAKGQELGFCQVCHGKAAPLRRIAAGDCVIYYSPTQAFRGSEPLQAFTALGFARKGVPYRVQQAENFAPYRLDIDWLPAPPVPIRPLLQRLSFTAGNRNWGYNFRFGLFEAKADDAALIAAEMGIDPVLLQ